ncbi:DNA methyltransferase [Staphylococcus epidermidis]|uniref:site-specific DNA-methyltransferase n=1 Tax=Staphylococcus epidermidis TaxID=1282 RepID=UPI00026C1738|nr:site-specific DNA-methyltransferase [Staphylococcus epidermidis]EJE05966.1 hypothetical protein HMPREF9983_05001 [Staphylococcus epidermidis NIHLM023]MBM0810719.1 site-specific DNA-methyltransferase [Staphylococcus epidermidis]
MKFENTNNNEYNKNVKNNTYFLDDLKEKLPEFFVKKDNKCDGENNGKIQFDIEKFQAALKENDIDELINGYQLKFTGKNYAKKQIGIKSNTIIVPDKDHNTKKINRDSRNLFFSGDNLEVLRHLQSNYSNSIDVIYIDPPYNTGLDGFLYPDKFEYKDEELINMFDLNEYELGRLKSIQNSSTHSAWLTFMYPRLYLAKKLLKETGVIFISIDDNEHANLKLMMDEIFGEESFIDQLMVEISNTGGMKLNAAKEGAIAKNGELILIYCKNSNQFSKLKKTPLFDHVEGFDTHYTQFLSENNKVDSLVNKINERNDILKDAEIILGSSGKISLKKFAEIFDKSQSAKDFIHSNLDKIARERTEIPEIPEDIKRKLEEGKWYYYKSDKREAPYYLGKKGDKIVQYATLSENYNYTDGFNPVYGRSVIRGDYWKNFWRDMGNVAKEDGVDFKNGKKPVRLIKQLIKWSGIKEGVVLDFFAGSGTTASAVLNNNYELNTSNNYILVQLPENLDERYKFAASNLKNDIKKQINLLDKFNRKHFIDELTQQRIENAGKSIDINANEKMDLGYKHYFVMNSPNNKLEDLEIKDGLQLNLFDDMLSKFSADNLGVKGKAEGKDSILATYLAKDNYEFDAPIKTCDFEGIETTLVNNQRLYIISNNWQTQNTISLVNAIGKNKIIVQTIVVFGYTIEMEVLRELEIALEQLNKKINLIIRY